MKFLTLTKTTKTKFFISCILTCLTLTACDDKDDRKEEPQKVITPPLVTVQEETNNTNDAEVSIDELDDLLNEISAETGQPLNEPKPETLKEPKSQPVEKVIENKPIISQNSNMLAVSLSKGLATGFNYQVANNKQWQQAEKDCFGNVNDDFAVNELAKIINTEFNQDEIQQVINFYHSPAGRQLEQWRDAHIADLVKNNNVSMNDMNISEEELSAITDFMASPANIKINQLIQRPQIEQLIVEKISPQLLACGMANNY